MNCGTTFCDSLECNEHWNGRSSDAKLTFYRGPQNQTSASSSSNVCPVGAFGLHTCQPPHGLTIPLPIETNEEPELPEHREDERNPGNPLFDPQPFTRDSFGECEIRVDTFGAPTPRWTQQERMLREWCLFYGNTVLASHEATVATPWFLTAQYIAKVLDYCHSDATTIASAAKILDLPQSDLLSILRAIKSSAEITAPQLTILAEAAAHIESGDGIPSTPSIDFYNASQLETFAKSAFTAYQASQVPPYPGHTATLRAEWQGLASLAVEARNRPHLALSFSPTYGISTEDAMDHRSFQPHQHIENLPNDDEEDNEPWTDEPVMATEEDTSLASDDDWAPLDSWIEGSNLDVQGLDFSFPTEAWHPLDEDHLPYWEDCQPSPYQLILGKIRLITSIPELNAQGQKIFALQASWTSQQRQVYWDAYNARKAALYQQVLRITRVRHAVEKIRRTKVQDIPVLSARLYAFTQQQPTFYPKDGLTVIWHELNQRRPAKV